MKTKKVKTRWVVSIPKGAKVLVRRGEEVVIDQVLFKGDRSQILSVDCRDLLVRLGKDQIEDLKKLIGKTFKKDELLMQGRGIGGVKIVMPQDGVFLGIDEFGNLSVESVVGDKIEVKAPVRAKVVAVDDSELSLEFEAREFKGEGIGGGRIWTEGEYRLTKDLDDFDWQDEGGVIFCQQLDLTMINKADVVGVRAMVTVKIAEEEMDRIETSFPIIVLGEDEMIALGQFMGTGKKYRILLDVAGDRLLIV